MGVVGVLVGIEGKVCAADSVGCEIWREARFCIEESSRASIFIERAGFSEDKFLNSSELTTSEMSFASTILEMLLSASLEICVILWIRDWVCEDCPTEAHSGSLKSASRALAAVSKRFSGAFSRHFMMNAMICGLSSTSGLG